MTTAGTDRGEMERCIDQCLEVVKLASRCADDCLKSDQVASMRKCIGLCLDSVGVAGLCAEMMAADSRFATRLCGLCADVCSECAEECRAHEGSGHEGSSMNDCAEACARCAESCRAMAA